MPHPLLFSSPSRAAPASHPLRWLPPVLLLALAAMVAFGGQNRALFLSLNQSARILPDPFWSCVTILGTGACAYALLAFTLVPRPRLMAASLITGVLAGVFTHLIKPVVLLARPAAVLNAGEFHLIGEMLTSKSFPSGHAVTVFAFAAMLIFFSRRPFLVASLALPLAVLVAFSRIAVGAHWPLDALGGACGGWLSGMAGEALSRRWPIWERRSWRLVFALAMIGLGVGLYLSELGYPEAIWLQRGLALFAVAGGLHALLAAWKSGSPA